MLLDNICEMSLDEDTLSTLDVLLDGYGPYPQPSDVRAGLTYGFGWSGTLAVPAPQSVAYNVATDNTVGTAVLTESNVGAALATWTAAALSGTLAAGSPGALWQEQASELSAIAAAITQGGNVIVSPPPIGSYCIRADVENVFGVSNVASWALLSTNDPNSAAGLAEIANRIQLEIQTQTAEIDDHLREGGYTLPLVVNESTISVVRLCATLVGVALYENRGTIDYNHETGRVEHRYQFKKDWANKRLDEIRSGKIRWDAQRPAGSSTAPMAQQTPRRRYGQQQDGLGNYGISGGNNY